MVNTIRELTGKKPSGLGIPGHDVFELVFDGSDANSLPMLLAGRKVVSIHVPGTMATGLTLQGSNFSSKTAPVDTDYKDGILTPESADFNDLKDSAGTVIVIASPVSDSIFVVSEAGFPVWLRLVQDAATAGNIYVSAKG